MKFLILLVRTYYVDVICSPVNGVACNLGFHVFIALDFYIYIERSVLHVVVTYSNGV